MAPTYYEDHFGVRNEDEEFDRFPDECESDSSSSSDDETSPPTNTSTKIQGNGIFKQFARPLFRPLTPKSGKSLAGKDAHISGTLNSASASVSNTNDLRSTSNTEKQPSPTTPTKKKLTPRKYGMFSTAQTQTPTPAAMTDALAPSGFGLGVDDGFPTLEMSEYDVENASQVTADSVREERMQGITFPPNPYSPTEGHVSAGNHPDPSNTAEKAVDTPVPAASPAVVAQQQQMVAVGAEDDGYIADQDELRGNASDQPSEPEEPLPTPKSRGRPPKGSTIALPRPANAEMLGRTRRGTTKIEEEAKAAKQAMRPRTRSTAAPAVAASKHDSKTARAAVMKRKSNKVVSGAGERVSKRRLVRGVKKDLKKDGRLTNWMEEDVKMGAGQGFVQLPAPKVENVMVNGVVYQKHY